MVVTLLLLKNTFDGKVFTKVFNKMREIGTLPSAQVSSECAHQQHVEEQENILEMVQRSPTISTRRLSTRLRVSRKRVWRTLHDGGFYTFHP
jgi:predicted HTH transcriptional regulator